jgi:hypothetical protein
VIGPPTRTWAAKTGNTVLLVSTWPSPTHAGSQNVQSTALVRGSPTTGCVVRKQSKSINLLKRTPNPR